MDQFMHKENIIEISEEKELDVKINGQQIVIESNKDSSLFFSPLSFCDATSPTDLACAIIDEQLALDEPDIQINDTKPKLDIRRNLAEFPDNDRDKFRDAVFLLKERGEYDKYIKYHGFTNNLGHSGPAFFAWHRVFLRKFELELQQLDQQYEDVTLPYWDYTSPNVDDHGNSKNWRDDFLGTNGVVSLKWTGKDGSEKKWILPGYQTSKTPSCQCKARLRRTGRGFSSRFVAFCVRLRLGNGVPPVKRGVLHPVTAIIGGHAGFGGGG